MTETYTNFFSQDVRKIFPVSFERVNAYDRVLSEENLVDWFRSVAADSSDLDKNSRYSYVITDTLSSGFGKNVAKPTQDFEFTIGGYYVKVSDRGFARLGTLSQKDIYAVISETGQPFRHLADGESINSDNDTLRALKFVTVPNGTDVTLESTGEYKLHILTVDSSNTFTIPAESKRSSSAVDGGEIA